MNTPKWLLRVTVTLLMVMAPMAAEAQCVNWVYNPHTNNLDCANDGSGGTAGVTSFNGRTGAVTPQSGDYAKADVGLGNVENTALSTWAGSGNVTAVGTLASGAVPWGLLTGVTAANPVFNTVVGQPATDVPGVIARCVAGSTEACVQGQNKITNAELWKIDANGLATGVSVLDAGIPAAITRDSELSAAIAALSSVYQPLDAQLTALADKTVVTTVGDPGSDSNIPTEQAVREAIAAGGGVADPPTECAFVVADGTTITCPHSYGHKQVLVAVYGSDDQQIGVQSVTRSTTDVVITLAEAQDGSVVINGGTGPQGEAGAGFADGNYGQVTIGSGGTTINVTDGTLVNADINASAAIAHSKMAALTASRAVVTDASGFASAASVTATELGYLSGVTSAIQTQLGAKQASDADLTALAAISGSQGMLAYYGASGWTSLSPGTSGQFLQTQGAGANPQWATPSGSGDVTAASAFATDNRLIRSDGTGKGVQASGVEIDDSDNVVVPGNLSVGGTISVGNGTVAGESVMTELTANGSEYRSWLSPDSLAATVRFRFPDAAPSAGDVMTFGAPSTNISSITFKGVASANTASAIVARDGSGNFSAGTITAALSGNATTATTASAGDSATAFFSSGEIEEARIHADIARDSEVTSAISALSSVYQPLDSDLTALAGISAANLRISTLGITIDGAGSAITTGTKGYIVVPFACTIQSWSVVADQSGSIVLDVWKNTTTPTNANTITASAKPTLSTAQLAVAQAATGWTTSVAANDVLGFEVESASTVTQATLTIACQR